MADRAGFEGYYREHLTRVVRACALVTLDPAAAEDVAAEAFARLWSHWGQIHDEDHAGGYVYKTAMRLCSKRGMKARREVIGEVVDRPAADESARSDERASVFAALGELSVRQRQAVVLRDWAGYPTEEVASMLGMRASTVRVHLSRGREALRRSLSVEERER
ncbi:MAG: sigma-70 family RNA polymerase sigma factor [Actinomycetota bacterium]